MEKRDDERVPNTTTGSAPVAGPSTVTRVPESHDLQGENSHRIQPGPCTAEDPSPATPAVTVEDFLRWSVAGLQPKSARKTRYVNLRDPPQEATNEADSDSSSEDESSSDEDEAPRVRFLPFFT